MLLEAQILPSDIDWFGLVCYFNLGLTYFISFLSAGVLPSLPYVTVIFLIVLIVLVGIAVRDWCCNLGMRSDPNLTSKT